MKMERDLVAPEGALAQHKSVMCLKGHAMCARLWAVAASWNNQIRDLELTDGYIRVSVTPWIDKEGVAIF
jgi:hypothetical protein